MNREARGTLLAIICVPIFGLFPIVVKYGVVKINPIVFGSYAALISAAFLIPFLLGKRLSIYGFLNLRLQLRLFAVALFGTFLSSVAFFIGSTMTSGINASILLQIEPVYSIFISRIFLSERISSMQLYATALVIGGTITVIYNGKPSVNMGDVLVLLTPLFWQISHFNSKRAMAEFKVDPVVISFARTLYGGLLLVAFAFFLYPVSDFVISVSSLWVVLFQGIVSYAIGFILWYKTLHLINLSKATALITPYPVFSFFMAGFILSERPTIYQIAGLIVVVAGIWMLSQVKSELISDRKGKV